MLGDCKPVLRANVHWCICSGRRPLAAWFAEQHCAEGKASCQIQRCSALVLGDCKPVWRANVHWCIAVAEGHWQPGLQSSTVQRGKLLAKFSAAVHWCWVTASLYGEQTSIGVLQWQKAAGSLVCRAALCRGDCFLPNPVLQCIGVE